MKYSNLLRSSLLCLSLIACSTGDRFANVEPTVIDLTQVGCQFLETEAQNFQYQPTSAEDCEQINSETLATRD